MKIDRNDIKNIFHFIFQIFLVFWNIKWGLNISILWLQFIAITINLFLMCFWIKIILSETRHLWFKVKPGDIFKLKNTEGFWTYNSYKCINKNKILIVSKIEKNWPEEEWERSYRCYFVDGCISTQFKGKSWFKNFEKIG